MSTIDKLINKAKSAAILAGKKTEEVMDNSKLRLQAVGIKNDISRVHERIGGLVCQGYKTGENFEDIIKKLVQDSADLEQELQEIEESINADRDSKRCDNCGAFCPQSAQFCVRCGEEFGSKEKYKQQAEDVTAEDVAE